MKRFSQGTGLQSVQVSSPVYSQVPLLLQKCHLGDEDHSPQTFLTFTLVHTPPLGIHQNDYLRVLTLMVLVASASGKQIPAMTI